MQDGSWFTLLVSRFTGYTFERGLVSCGNLSFRRTGSPVHHDLGPLNELVSLRLSRLIQGQSVCYSSLDVGGEQGRGLEGINGMKAQAPTSLSLALCSLQ